MNIELINTGAELLVGRVLNTHQQWLCRQLSDLGYEVTRQVCVSDGSADIRAATQDALQRANLVITTGGLGPTSDDLTRDVIAQMLSRKLVLHQPTLDWITNYFGSRRRDMPESVKVQAMAPEGAVVLPNPNGTAPGLALQVKSQQWLVMLPGPPRELRPMFRDQVVPLLQKQFPLPFKFLCRTFKTTGMGESAVEEKIAGPMKHLVTQGLELAYCARVGEVDVRLSARGSAAESLLAQGEQILRAEVGPIIFGTGDDSLESVIIRLLTERKQSLALAESCTGGYLAHRLTNIPGASQVFLGGVVTYSNQAKETTLGVPSELLREHGAVSKPVALAMAEGARRVFQSDYALSITGIAGPGGGTPEKPAGTAFIGFASPAGSRVLLSYTPLDRETFKFVVTQKSLDLLREALGAEPTK